MTAITYGAVRPSAQPRPRYRLSFGGAVASEWIKLRSMRFTWWNAAALLVFGTGMAWLMAKSVTWTVQEGIASADAGLVVAMGNMGVVFVGVVIALVLGSLAATSEYSSGSIRATLGADPRRGYVLGAKAVVVAGFMAVLAVLAVALGTAVAAAVAAPADIAFDWSAATWKAAAGAVLYLVVCSVIGLGLGVCLRSSAGAIAVGLGFFLVLDMVASWAQGYDLVRVIHEVLPMGAGPLVYAGPLGEPDSVLGGYWGGVACLVAWAAAALLGGYAVLKKRDA